LAEQLQTLTSVSRVRHFKRKTGKPCRDEETPKSIMMVKLDKKVDGNVSGDNKEHEVFDEDHIGLFTPCSILKVSNNSVAHFALPEKT
jgi:hypothetical protein